MANSEGTAGVRQLFAIRTAGAITGLAQSSHGQQRQYIERVVWVVGVEYDYVGSSWRQDDVVAVRHAVLVAVGHFDDKWQITLYRCLDLTSRHTNQLSRIPVASIHWSESCPRISSTKANRGLRGHTRLRLTSEW
jgi:hypothetical protein